MGAWVSLGVVFKIATLFVVNPCVVTKCIECMLPAAISEVEGAPLGTKRYEMNARGSTARE